MNELPPDDVAKAARDRADRQKLEVEALGWDADNPAVLSHYQNLQGMVASERITQQEAFERMKKQEFEIADKERRDAAKKERENQQASEQPKAEKDATAERMAGRGEKEAEARKIDVARFRSDPDYRREVKERTAEQLKEERQQRGNELERDGRER